MSTVGDLLLFVVWVAIALVIARFVLDWVQLLARSWRPSGAVAVLCEGIYSATDPPLRAVRSVLPPVRLGSMALDLSPMIVLFALYLLLPIIRLVFY